jgi:hypothetical protein
MPVNSTTRIDVVVQVDDEVLYELSPQDTLVVVTAIPTGGTIVALPSDPSSGDYYEAADGDGSCSSTAPLSFAVTGAGQTIRGSSSFVMTTAYASAGLRYDETSRSWLVFEAGGGGTGGAGETVARVPFTFASASPLLLLSIPAGSAVNRCALVITTTFDDPTATLSVGTAFSPAALLATSDIEPGIAGQYESDLIVPFTPAETLILTLSPAGSTQGAGYVLLKEQ